MGSSVFHPSLSLTLFVESVYLSRSHSHTLFLNLWCELPLSFVNYDMLLSFLSAGKD